MPRLSAEQRLQIVTLHNDAGHSILQLSQRFQCDRRTVQRLLAKHRVTGSTEDLPRPGQPRVSTAREDRTLVRMSAANPHLVARQLRQRWSTEHGVQASTSTVKSRLFNAGLVGRISKRKPLLSQQHKNARLQWARERQHWTVDDWRRCFFSDESPIHLVMSRQQRYVRRRGGTALHPGHTRPTVHASSGKILVWGGFSHHGPNPLVRIRGTVTAAAYCDILQEHLLPLNLPRRGLIFQQDNATSHRARRTQQFLEENNIEVLPWPAQSPDLNPIENLWSHLQQEVDRIPVQGFDGLWEAALNVWQNLPQGLIDNLINSMPRRVEAVITARGGPTKY